MIKQLASKLTTISWGWGAACFALLAFVALSVVPLLADPNDQKARKDSVVGMMEKAAEKSKEAQAMKAHGGDKKVEFRSAVLLPDGTLYASSKMGLYKAVNGHVTMVEGFPGKEEIRSLATDAQGHLYTAGKDGVYRLASGQWTQLHTAEAQQVQASLDGTLVIAGKHLGVLLSQDGGKSWNAPVPTWNAAAVGPKDPCAGQTMAMTQSH